MLEVYLGVFFASAIAVYFFAKFLKRKELLTADYCKKGKMIPHSGGIALLPAIWIGILSIYWITGYVEAIGFGLLVSAFSLIGFFDDLKSKWNAKTIPWKIRAIAIGIVSLAFAWFFSPSVLWIVPIALYIAGIASLQNTFEGLNGWSVGNGFIVALAASVLLPLIELRTLALVLAFSVFGLLLWNKWPAKVLPGDSGTLLIGAGIAGLFVLSGRIELMAFSFLLFLPNLFDFFVLKLFSPAKDPSQSKILPYKVLENGKIGIQNYEKGKIQWDFAKMILHFTGPLKEWKIVAIIWLIVALNAVLWLSVYRFVQIT